MTNSITIKNFLSKEECDLLLKFSLSKELEIAKIGNGDGKLSNYRNSNIFFYDYTLNFPNLNKKLIKIFEKEVNVKGHTIDFTNNNFQFTEYKTDGYYKWHEDSSSDMHTERYCSMVIQLNDEYEGGELQIKDKDNTEITLEKGLGNLFLFYSHITHRVKPVTSGTRYSLVNWFRLTPIENFKKTLI